MTQTSFSGGDFSAVVHEIMTHNKLRSCTIPTLLWKLQDLSSSSTKSTLGTDVLNLIQDESQNFLLSSKKRSMAKNSRASRWGLSSFGAYQTLKRPREEWAAYYDLWRREFHD